MCTFVEKAYAKINLGLDIVSKREDGYHEVNMVMHSIDLYDTLKFTKRIDNLRRYSCNIEKLKMDEHNLVCKAADKFCEEYGIEDGFSIELTKVIPMAAGLAGGSSDAAAVLRGLNRLFDVGATTEELMIIGQKIGADVPYCIMGGTAWSRGIGEILDEISAPAKTGFLVVKPPVDVSTKWAYDAVDGEKHLIHPDIDGLILALNNHDSEAMYEKMGNIFEDFISKEHPIIADIKNAMTKCGAKVALMSGSGPTVFGMFEDCELMEHAYDKIKLMDHEFIYKIW